MTLHMTMRALSDAHADTDIDTGRGRPIGSTKETRDRLQAAYAYFNEALFGGTLPNALITLQHRKSRFAASSGARFADAEAMPLDEIALDPALYAERPFPDILAGLVHDMVHLWQHQFGQPGRGRYHNREWAGKMKSIGLLPVGAGKDGDKETGETVGQIIVPGGPFSQAADRLIGEGFAIDWRAILPPAVAADNTAGIGSSATGRSGKRLRYRCPGCDLKAWAKHGAKLICGEHRLPMTAE